MRGRIALGTALLTLLTACGGGGSVTTSNPPPDADPQGFWQGNTSNGRAVNALVLPTGQYYAIYSTSGVVNGMLEGTFLTSGNTITDDRKSVV